MRFKDEVPCLDTFKVIRGETEAKTISGAISWDRGDGNLFSVEWRAVLNPPGGTMYLTYSHEERKPESETKNFVYFVSLKNHAPPRAGRGNRRISKWAFFCPVQSHRSCRKWARHLFLGLNGYFGCERCAKVFRRNTARDHKLDGLCKKPRKMAMMLGSRLIPIKKKLEILEIAARVIARHQEMKRKVAFLRRKLAKLEQCSV